ncbi:flagellar hook-length control protein FliK [Rhodopseudomonas palustris]|uniref:Flagellar hook-length control protein-like C-terminal domain-containing protein n=1 Tax=Rhodopseudomonas palustris (strain BisB18) TaxID=316056 RepID=Q211J6_RHOPB
MSIAVNSTLPIIAAQGTSDAVALQPGTVVTARVVKVDGDQAQISIGQQSLTVRSDVALQAGQTLQLSVSQSADGVRLAVLPQPSGAQLNPTAAQLSGHAAAPDAATLAPEAALSLVAAQRPVPSVALQAELSATETVAVATAAQLAAAKQGSLATLFANLAAVDLSALPPKLQAAVNQLLAQRTALDPALSGNDVKRAFQSSGLFLESGLASGAATATPIFDLKAALIVLRQVLATALGNAATQGAVPTPASMEGRLQAAALAASNGVTTPVVVAAPTIASTATPIADLMAQQLASQKAAASLETTIAGLQTTTPVVVPAATAAEAGARSAASNAALNVLQEALQANPLAAGQVAKLLSGNAAMLSLLPLVTGTRLSPATEEELALRGNALPPPIRGALPTVQPVAPASLISHEPFAASARHLFSDTDAAIARQTLLQIASLPDRLDPAVARTDPATARWNFEIPFVTAQGTAVAQFEISREQQDSEVDAAKRVWRARFSLDVEPAGPVHALISLVGDKTSVRMWAERPATAAQLRAGSAELSRALSRAELQPGDIVIREGAPTQPPAAAAGYFLDRAL